MENLEGVTMHVSDTDAIGVVGSETILRFRQCGDRVWARYAGGRVASGWLVGQWKDNVLHFRYAQVEDGRIDAGASRCHAERLEDGRLRLYEHFTWRTRDGSGVNVFEQVP